MMLVEHLVEPKKLTLAWQSLRREDGRRRYAVGELSTSEFRYLVDSVDFAEARRLGFSGYPAFRLSAAVHTGSVVAPFLRRIPPRTRADFPKFMEAIGLHRGSQVTDLALLAYSEARDISDGFSLVNRFEGVKGPLEFVTEVAGFRYENRSEAVIEADKEVRFVREPENAYDVDAIRVENSFGSVLGYVNRLQNTAMARWMAEGVVRGWIHRKNGHPAHPRLFLFVRVSGAISAAA